ncbi:hypothetical protein F5148DRAFT_1365999 [Russula earlei]|uniref:Uncharacterized protein n=1 Tax=Russula earlei TaxID=71964 RepID=A0ACC0UJU4_9AGAM|nr:hypothetical protein F5148DRAFT_1365999 [Russula earlei]
MTTSKKHRGSAKGYDKIEKVVDTLCSQDANANRQATLRLTDTQPSSRSLYSSRHFKKEDNVARSVEVHYVLVCPQDPPDSDEMPEWALPEGWNEQEWRRRVREGRNGKRNADAMRTFERLEAIQRMRLRRETGSPFIEKWLEIKYVEARKETEGAREHVTCETDSTTHAHMMCMKSNNDNRREMVPDAN